MDIGGSQQCAPLILTVFGVTIVTCFLLDSEQMLLHKLISIKKHNSEPSSELNDSETKSKDTELNVRSCVPLFLLLILSYTCV